MSLLVGPEMAQDFRIKRFLKGLANLRPSLPKYNATWDPKIVLDYFTRLGSNDKLTLQELTSKLITLLALTTGHRMQTFANVKIDNIEVKDKKAEIKIPDRIKTTGTNRKQPILVLPVYCKNRKICPVMALKIYLDRTKSIRNSINNLFISIKCPYKAVKEQTLSRWVMKTLKNSGIDISIFSAHSTRHASTSTAKRRGISTDAISKTVGWTESSRTFAKFYDLNIVENNGVFAKAILNF